MKSSIGQAKNQFIWRKVTLDTPVILVHFTIKALVGFTFSISETKLMPMEQIQLRQATKLAEISHHPLFPFKWKLRLDQKQEVAGFDKTAWFSQEKTKGEKVLLLTQNIKR